MNKYIFNGNITKDAEVRQAGQSTVCSFTVAVNDGYGDKKHTEFVKCSLWGKRAEGGLPKFLTKGASVLVEGSPRLDKREHEGKTYADISVRVNELDLIGGRNDSGNTGAPETKRELKQEAMSDDLDDPIPF